MLDDLNDFIQSNPDARELKRAVAVQMFLKGYKHREIRESLGVSSGFVTKWTQCYQGLGVDGLKLGYAGSASYLEAAQQASVMDWLKRKKDWNLAELQNYIEQQYQVTFSSRQSYYALFKQAGISWKKTQKYNPKADPALVEKKTGD
jgi:putative transposase